MGNRSQMTFSRQKYGKQNGAGFCRLAGISGGVARPRFWPFCFYIFFVYIFISSHPREGEPKLGLTEPAISLLSEPKGSCILQYAALLEENKV